MKRQFREREGNGRQKYQSEECKCAVPVKEERRGALGEQVHSSQGGGRKTSPPAPLSHFSFPHVLFSLLLAGVVDLAKNNIITLSLNHDPQSNGAILHHSQCTVVISAISTVIFGSITLYPCIHVYSRSASQ